MYIDLKPKITTCETATKYKLEIIYKKNSSVYLFKWKKKTFRFIYSTEKTV